MNISNTTDNPRSEENHEKNTDDVFYEKLNDALIPGYAVEFDPAEAERAGAFIEDALTLEK